MPLTVGPLPDLQDPPALSAPAPSGPSPRMPMVAAGAGGILDLLATQRVLAAGGRELNPILGQNRAVNAALKGGTTLAGILAVKALADRGHPRAAQILGYLFGGVSGAAGTHNLLLDLPPKGR